MTDAVLVLNAGSSSLKFSVFAVRGEELALAVKGQIEGLSTAPHFAAQDSRGAIVGEEKWPEGTKLGPDGALDYLASFLPATFAGYRPIGFGHRVVHGGMKYAGPVRVDTKVLAELEELIHLAPLHQPHNLGPIRSALARWPEVPQVACFDTAFHRGQPKMAELFGLPREYYDRGVRRYGFHGLSYEYIVGALPSVAPEIAAGRVVIAHLGSGASMCAVREGRSVASTMGFTALEGLVMGTRTGSLDAGVVLYLLRREGMSLQEVEDLLYKRSGLLGLSGVSNDMRVLLESPEPAAREAVDYFAYRAARELGSLAGALGGLDGIVFTAGIGENSAEVRGRICTQVGWLGLELDPAANRAGGPRLSLPGSRVSAWVIPTNEELMIARHTAAALGGWKER